MSSKIPRISGQNSNKSKLSSQSQSSATKTSEERVVSKSKSKSKVTTKSTTLVAKKPTSSFSNGTQKTMSYTQLKQEVLVLQEQNDELRNKSCKHQNALHTSQKTTKHLQKENEELQQQVTTTEREFKDTIESRTQEWTSRNDHLTGRLSKCEVKLEELGVDPVSMDRLQDDDTIKQQRSQAVESARVLQQKLEDNITRNQEQLHSIKDLSTQVKQALAELDEQ